MNSNISPAPGLEPLAGFDYTMALKIRNSTDTDFPFGTFAKFNHLECTTYSDRIEWEIREGIANNEIFAEVFDLNGSKIGAETWVHDSPLFYILYERNEYTAVLDCCKATSIHMGIMPGRRLVIVCLKGTATSAYCIPKSPVIK